MSDFAANELRMRTLRRFRRKVLFLSLVPYELYVRLDPAEWYYPQGIVEEIRTELEDTLGCYILPYKMEGPPVHWFRRLYTFIKSASLTFEQREFLDDFERRLQARGKAVILMPYQKPVTLRDQPYRHPYLGFEPEDYPEADEEGLLQFLASSRRQWGSGKT